MYLLKFIKSVYIPVCIWTQRKESALTNSNSVSFCLGSPLPQGPSSLPSQEVKIICPVAALLTGKKGSGKQGTWCERLRPEPGSVPLCG